MSMQKIFEDLGKKGQGVIVAVSGKTKEVVENTTMLLRTEQALKEEIYNLGLSFYEKYKNAKKNSPTRKYFEDQINYITELLEEKEVSKANLAESFGKKCCEECGKPVKDGDAYCPNCGTPVDEEDEFVQDDTIKHCQNCGAEQHDKDQRFCGKCGTKLIK